MILSSAVRYLLLLGYVAAVKIDLREICGSNSLSCTIADYNDEVLVVDNPKTTAPFTELIFRSCYLPKIPSTIFSVTQKLERLLMYKCLLKSIEQRNFHEAIHLRFLYLPNNHLAELPERVFGNLSLVEEIRAPNNRISYMHAKAFIGLWQLRVLDLNNNKLHELTTGVFNNLTRLEYIDLSFNDIEVIDSKVFETNLRLKTILLNNNNFAVFESNSLVHLPHLNVLDISYNNINTIRLQSVDTLRAQSSQLRSCVIKGSVIRVRASNNQLQSISIFDKNSLKEIDVHSNQFESLSDFHEMLNLQKLDVSKNAIRSLNSTNASLLLDLPSLQSLNLASGQLQYLSVENFALLGKLTHLDLANNGLQQLHASVFQTLVGLEKIYFDGNHIRSFEYETFLRNHQNIKEMGIFGNDWPQTYLKKMMDVLKANNIKLIIRSNANEAVEMLSLQTTSHPHHIVHSKVLDHATDGTHAPTVNKRDILIIVTLCLVLLILVLQLFRILKDENVFALFNQRIHRSLQSTRLDEEESEPL